ncbi:hypothetical protein RhiirB3_409176, partial [Rhizophagus irregularis]
MPDIELTCRLHKKSGKHVIRVNTGDTIDSLIGVVKRAFGCDEARDIVLWKTEMPNELEDAFTNLILAEGDNMTRLTAGILTRFWGEGRLLEDHTHVIIDSPTLEKNAELRNKDNEIDKLCGELELYSDENASDYIITDNSHSGEGYLKDLCYAKIIRINDVLRIKKRYKNINVHIQCKVTNFDDGMLSVMLDRNEEQEKGFFSLAQLEKWLVEHSLDAEDIHNISYEHSGDNIEIIRNERLLGSIRTRRNCYIYNQKNRKDSAKLESKQDADLSETLSRLSITDGTDRDSSIDSESITVSVFDQYETGDNRSDTLSHVYTPEQVRTYLKEFGFDQSDAEKWDQPIEVPIGVDTSLWIAREAVIYGLKFEAISLYPELIDYARGFGEIPDFVTTKYQMVDTNRLVTGGDIHEPFPKSLGIIKWQLQKGLGGLDEILGLIVKEKNITTHDLLYRGVRAYGLIPDDISYGFSANSLDCDFGRGLYTTPSIEYAIKHIKDCGSIRVGALMVFDWKDHGGRGLETKRLEGEEWTGTVKACICNRDTNNKKRGPLRLSGDILVGAISSNNEAVGKCATPIPSNDKQVVGRTQKGLKAFENRLMAIIYLF